MANEIEILLTATDKTSGAVKSATVSLASYNNALERMIQQEKSSVVSADVEKKFKAMTEAEKDAFVATQNLTRATEEQAKAQTGLGSVLGGIGNAFTAVNQALEIGQKVYSAINSVLDETVVKFQAYAEQVRSLSVISGQSAEATSRFIQVLDDWQVSAETAEMATKALTKNGLAPNMETLAKLSDQYLAITDTEERNAFVLKNLGKAGLEWNQVLDQGSAALLEQSAAVSAKLILDEQQIANAETLRLAQDELNDSTDALKISIGSELVPVQQNAVDMTRALINAAEQELEQGPKYTSLYRIIGGFLESRVASQNKEKDALNSSMLATGDLARAQEGAAQSAARWTAAGEAKVKAQEAEAKAATELTAKYQSLLSMTQSVASAENNFAKTSADLAAQRIDAANKVAEAEKKTWDMKGITEAKGKLAEIDKKIAETAATYQAETAKIIYSNLLAKLSVDGLTDAEFNKAQQAGVTLGIFTQAQADQAIAINDMTTAVANGTLSVDAMGKAIAGLPSGKTIDIIANLIAGAAGSRQYTGRNEGRDSGVEEGRAAGTAPGGFGGGLTWVGETGRELVRMPQGAQVMSSPQSRDISAAAAAPRTPPINYEELGRVIARAMTSALARSEFAK